MTAREIVQAIAYGVGDDMFRRRTPAFYLNRANIALRKVVKDTHALIKAPAAAITTTASRREYNVVDDWGLTDFLAVHHLRINGYVVFPAPYEMRDLDLKNNVESNRVKLYVYLPGPHGVGGSSFAGGYIYLEPIPSDVYTVDLYHVYAPSPLDYDNNNALPVGDEYAPLVESLGAALVYPPGSVRRVEGIREYRELSQDMLFDRENETEPLDVLK